MEGEKGGKFEGKSSGGKALLLNESTIPGGGAWTIPHAAGQKTGCRALRVTSCPYR